MDSTIVTSETLDEIAAFAGLKPQIAEITRRSMNGELDFRAALIERVGMLAGLDVGAGADLGGDRADRRGTRAGRHHAGGRRDCALVSGGFTFFTGRVAALVGFHAHHSNTLEIADGSSPARWGSRSSTATPSWQR